MRASDWTGILQNFTPRVSQSQYDHYAIICGGEKQKVASQKCDESVECVLSHASLSSPRRLAVPRFVWLKMSWVDSEWVGALHVAVRRFHPVSPSPGLVKLLAPPTSGTLVAACFTGQPFCDLTFVLCLLVYLVKSMVPITFIDGTSRHRYTPNDCTLSATFWYGALTSTWAPEWSPLSLTHSTGEINLFALIRCCFQIRSWSIIWMFLHFVWYVRTCLLTSADWGRSDRDLRGTQAASSKKKVQKDKYQWQFRAVTCLAGWTFAAPAWFHARFWKRPRFTMAVFFESQFIAHGFW